MEDYRKAYEAFLTLPKHEQRKQSLERAVRGAMCEIEKITTSETLPAGYGRSCETLLETIASLPDEEAEHRLPFAKWRIEEIVGKLLFAAYQMRNGNSEGGTIFAG